MISNNEKHLFAAGLTQETKRNAAFISVHFIDKKMNELSTVVFKDVTHPEKKGFYRLAKFERGLKGFKDVILTASWLDLSLFSFDGKRLQHVFSYNGLHSSKC